MYNKCYREASQSVTKNRLHAFEQGLQQRRRDVSQVRWSYCPCLPQQWPHQLHLCILWLPPGRDRACSHWSATHTKGMYYYFLMGFLQLPRSSVLYTRNREIFRYSCD